MQRTAFLLPLFLLLMVAACNESEKPAQSDQPNSEAGTADTSAMPASKEPLALKNTLSPAEVFAELVYNEYARRGATMPKQALDSLFKLYSNNTEKMEAEMNAYMKRVDDNARAQLAQSLKIPVDSVNAIIATKEKQRAAEGAQ